MKTTGQKIKLLRIAAGLTQEQLAEGVGITVKSIQRYETEASRPDVYVLARLAVFFDISTDYLLNLIGYQDQLDEELFRLSNNGQCTPLYAHYLHCKNNYTIDPNSEYYAIELHSDSSISAQTVFAGWANSDRTHEIRQIRIINPYAFIELYQSLRESFIVINSKEDVDAFLIFGGKALIKTDLCKKHLPSFCRDFIVSRNAH